MIARVLELLPLAEEHIVARYPLGREIIAHREIDDTQPDKHEHDFDRRAKPLTDCAQQEKSAQRVDIGAVEQQLLTVGERHGRDRNPLRLDAERHPNTY